MNKLKGHISHIETAGDLSVVTVGLPGEFQLKVIVIETPDTAPYLSIGHAVFTLFKETEVILSTEQHPAISILNRIPCILEKIETGKLLSRIELRSPAGNLVGVVPTASLALLSLQPGQNVFAMIKFNEIMLSVR